MSASTPECTIYTLFSRGFGVTAAQPPLEGPFGGALKKVYVAVTSGRISHGCLAEAQWTALGGVGRCAARVRHA